MEKLLKDSFMFRGLSECEISLALSSVFLRIERFKKDEIIFAPDNFKREIGFVLNGKCAVYKSNSHGSDVPLNSLLKNDSFGVISVFSAEKEYPTEIRAVEDSEVAFLKKDDVFYLVRNYPLISENIIKFLADKILFLNDKISTFSAYNVEQKLSSYLLQLYKKTQKTTLAFSKTECAKAINSGRASLYRAIDLLREKGIIQYENKKIIINDPQGLERNSK